MELLGLWYLHTKLSRMVAPHYIPSRVWYPSHTTPLSTLRLVSLYHFNHSDEVASQHDCNLHSLHDLWSWATLVWFLALWTASFVKYLYISFAYFSWAISTFYWFFKLSFWSSLYILNTCLLTTCTLYNFHYFCGLILQNFLFYFSKLFDIYFQIRGFCVLT